MRTAAAASVATMVADDAARAEHLLRMLKTPGRPRDRAEGIRLVFQEDPPILSCRAHIQSHPTESVLPSQAVGQECA